MTTIYINRNDFHSEELSTLINFAKKSSTLITKGLLHTHRNSWDKFMSNLMDYVH